MRPEAFPLRRTSNDFVAMDPHGRPPRQRTARVNSLCVLAPERPALARLGAAFFIFGVINNALYVVILTAALELLPAGVPTGVVACANIAPALVSKALFPYILAGTVRYARRIWLCSIISFVGLMVRLNAVPCTVPALTLHLIQMIALSSSLVVRLSGIALASFTSGLGELTFLQLSTRYSRSGASGHGVGWFASGTGGAGLVGATAWWIVRPLGVKGGLSTLSPLPWGMILVYLCVLPSPSTVQAEQESRSYAAVPTAEPASGSPEDEDEDGLRNQVTPGTSAPDTGSAANDRPSDGEGKPVRLSLGEKLKLLRPMLLPYIVPLFL